MIPNKSNPKIVERTLQPSLAGLISFRSVPNVETLGHSRVSLRDRKEDDKAPKDLSVWDPRSYRVPYQEWQKTALPQDSVKLAKAKARVAGLTAEDKAALMKWMGK